MFLSLCTTVRNSFLKDFLVSDEALHEGSALTALTTGIVSAYVSNNPVPPGELPALIVAVNSALQGVQKAPKAKPAEPVKPAVPVRRSITPDYLYSLEDGKPYKALKRHLSALGLTPEEYRAKWGLRSDYPMVAPNYSKVRSETAKRIGLGQKAAE